MKVRELIAALKKLPPDLETCVWDADEDDYVPVVVAFYEDGTSSVDLMPFDPATQSAQAARPATPMPSDAKGDP